MVWFWLHISLRWFNSWFIWHGTGQLYIAISGSSSLGRGRTWLCAPLNLHICEDILHKSISCCTKHLMVGINGDWYVFQFYFMHTFNWSDIYFEKSAVADKLIYIHKDIGWPVATTFLHIWPCTGISWITRLLFKSCASNPDTVFYGKECIFCIGLVS